MQHFLEQLDMQPKSNRLEHIDILKGLLIILVVIGHIGGIPTLHKYIYWFHMPCFFMISGYLFQAKKKKTKNIIITKIQNYTIPYLFWSIFFYLIFIPEPIPKNIIRVIWGGSLNSLQYSYQFWFINALCLASIIFYFFQKIENNIIKNSLLIIMITITYLLSNTKLLTFYPWECQTVPLIIVYMFIGLKLKDIQINHYKLLTIFTIIIFTIIYDYFTDYRFSLKGLGCVTNPIIDLLLPTAIFILLNYFSKLLTKSAISLFLTQIGSASMFIFFTHTACINIMKGYNVNHILIIIFCILSPTILKAYLSKIKYSNYIIGK